MHPGRPFWAKKDEGAWSIPKGTYDPSAEAPLTAAKREFVEETGADAAAVSKGEAIALGAFRQSPAKIVDVWAVEGEFDPARLKSNTFSMEWPPRSGRMREVQEVDRAEWFTPEAAVRKILKGQRAGDRGAAAAPPPRRHAAGPTGRRSATMTLKMCPWSRSSSA